MRRKEAWMFLVKFPDTFEEFIDRFENRGEDWIYFVPYTIDILDPYDERLIGKGNVRVGDYVLYVASHGNSAVIEQIEQELTKRKDNFPPDVFQLMTRFVREAKEEYAHIDGKIICIGKVKELTDKDGKRYACYSRKSAYFDHADKYSADLLQSNITSGLRELNDEQIKGLLASVAPKYKQEDLCIARIDRIIDDARIGCEFVQAFVTNNTFYGSLEELLTDYRERGKLIIESLFVEEETEWTAPKWCKKGDVAFFMFAKTANAKISRLRSEFIRNEANYSDEERILIRDALRKGTELYKKYGGCIFAYAIVSDGSFYYERDENSFDHWRSPIYAEMEDVTILKHPVSINDFRDFLTISRQQTITPVLGEAFDKLRELIIKHNRVPEYFSRLRSLPVPLKDIDKSNWMIYGAQYRRSFLLEEAFRKYYVDYLLAELGDNRSFYRECGCYKIAGNPPRVDNIIVFDGKYLPIEVKHSH